MNTAAIPPTETLPISRLVVRKFNPNKMSRSEYRLLVQAIQRMGFLQPVLVRPHPSKPERFEVVDGAHRLKAAKEIGLKEVPCVRRDATSDAEAGVLQIGMNKNRGDLDLGAASTAISEFVDEGWKIEDLVVTGFSEEELRDLLQVASASAESVLENADVPRPAEPEEAEPGSFVLELAFETKTDMQRAKQALRRAAGKGGSLASGLLRFIDGT